MKRSEKKKREAQEARDQETVNMMMVCLSMALHDEFGFGKARLEKIFAATGKNVGLVIGDPNEFLRMQEELKKIGVVIK